MSKEELQSTSDSEVVELARCSVMKGTVPCYFGSGSTPDIRDIIVYVRERHPNPHQRVLITTDMGLPVKDLLDQLIYIEGVNDNKLSEVRGLGSTVFLPIRIDEEAAGQQDYGIYNKVLEFTQVHGIASFEILIYGDDQAMLAEVWSWLHETGDIKQRVMFPMSVTRQLKLFDNGIDIAPYAVRLEQAAHRNVLTTKFLRDIMDELRTLVKSGKTAIQNFEDTRTLYSQWLTMALIQEFDLAPVYTTPYINEYVRLEIAYPFEKLSLFERLSFVSNLPANVGYIGRSQEFRCLYQIIQKIYPVPTLAYDVQADEVIRDNLERFDMHSMQIIDYRSGFPGSRNYFVPQSTSKSTGVAVQRTSDRDSDAKLQGIFLRMMKSADVEDMHLTVRNTIMAKFAGRMYILYYNEPLGLVGALQSEYFGAHPMVVQEEDFKNLIDAKIILAMRRKEAARNVSVGNSEFRDIMVRAANTFKPALPVFVQMCCALTGSYGNELSYYDKRLRCDKRITPIITHIDSELKGHKTLFDYITLENIVGDPVAAGAISSFGTLIADDGHTTTLPVSIESFRGHKLL